MDANLNWVEANLQRQRKILEEKQKQRRLQSAGAVRSTFSSHSGTSTSTFNPSLQEDVVSHPIEIKVKEAKLDSNWGDEPPSNGHASSSSANASSAGDALASSLNASMIFKNTAEPKPGAAAAASTDPIAPPVNAARLGDAKQIEKSVSEEESDVKIKPWQDENKLEESVLEDCANIDISKAIVDLNTFVNDPVKRGGTMRCTITRDKKGVEKGWYPAYYMHYERDAEKRFFLLAARRRKKCITGSYLLSTDPTEMSRDGKSFVGKVRANAVGTFFTVYDHGCNPKKSVNIGEGIRQELVGIIYEKNVFGWNGPRKMTILIPAMQGEGMGQRKEIRPICEKDSLIERFKSGKNEDMIILQNKSPMWSEETQSFVLNFRGRVTQASVKNFQIIHEGNPDYIVLQFGRTNDCTFTLDFRYPLTPLQAFGIAMSSFHGKLACE